MEQPSFNNAIFNNTSEPLLNGGQLTTSDSSSAASSNGTPSHSHKGSLSQSSPSSDELPISADVQNGHPNKLPFTASVSLSKHMTNIMADGRQSGLNNISEYPAPLISANIAQNPNEVSRMTMFNQNVFQKSAAKTPAFDNDTTNISHIRSTNIYSNTGDYSQVASPEKYKQITTQLPSSISSTTSASSYFNKSTVPNAIDFTSDHVLSKGNAPITASTKTPSNIQIGAIPSQSIPNQAHHRMRLATNEQTTPNQVMFSGLSSTHSQCPNPTLEGPEQSLTHSVPLKLGANPNQQSQTRFQSVPSQTQYTMQQGALPLNNSATQSISNSNSYKNVNLQQNANSFSPEAEINVNRFQLPSSSLSKSAVGMRGIPSLYNTASQSVSQVDQNFGSYGQMNQMTSPYSMTNQPVIEQQPRPGNTNRMYQMNGHQSLPYQNQSYGQQYQEQPQYHGGPRNSSHLDTMTRQFGGLNVVQQGYSGMRGTESCDLLRMRDVLPKKKLQAPAVQFPNDISAEFNCNPDIFRCTLTKIPETKSLLDKSRLPLGILLHPFRDLTNLSVIQCSTIVRCRSCRTYINPFVYFMDSRHWKCNLCFRANDLPDDFRYNPLTKMHDDPLRRPEVQSATIEFIAPSEYMVRPPQPAMYVFVLDVSRIATQTGYLATVCEIISANLTKLPGDSRLSVGFIAVDSAIRFYDLGENLNRPHELIVTDVDDVFIPFPENLIVNLHEQFELIKDLLEQIPEKFKESYDSNFALGAALQAAHKLLAPTGGRITVFLSCLPNYGPGALKPREELSQRANNNVNLNPATDFYKKLALECNGVHVSVDLFVVNAQFVDLATISGISQVSGGCMHHFPLYSYKNTKDVEKLVKTLERYLTRKIGFEAVMRLRCTKGLSIHSFHGNFFVRTTDLLALPNINPDAGFGMQISIDENLSDLQTVSFQAALLYTSSLGERRIRVHTLCLPVTNNLHDVLISADQQCIAGLLAKMAVDRSLQASIADAREAFVNAVCDILNSYKIVSHGGHVGTLFAPSNLALFPLYILGLLKSVAFRLGQNTRTDDRVFAMYQMKCIPLDRLIQIIYPDMYAIHNMNMSDLTMQEADGKVFKTPHIIQLSAERVDSSGIYLLDESEVIIIFICHNVPPALCHALLGYAQFSVIPENLESFPVLETPENKLANEVISGLQKRKPNSVVVHILKDTIQTRTKFYERMVEDKTEFGVSYYEFLQSISSQMN